MNSRKKFKKYLKNNISILILLGSLLLLSGIAHGYNMFNFPYYENDEGVYISQAWSIVTQGKLSPYTYWYDHAPAGWILIALWVKITGGFFTFGNAINSGRMLMLLLHLGSGSLLFYIGARLSKSYLAGVTALLIFSLSPLAIYFQRRALLDNIMIFWVLLSLALILKKTIRLKYIAASSAAFGISILTKEYSIFFIPGFLYLIHARAKRENKDFALTIWISVVGFLVSVYFLYALLKGELFPVGFLGNNTEKVSLITTLREQLARGAKSDFINTFNEWFKRDPYTITVGSIATIINLFLSIKNKSLRALTLLSGFYWLFLARGKLVLNLYVISLIPLLALNIGALTNLAFRKLSVKIKPLYEPAAKILAIAFILPNIIYPLLETREHYVRNETKSQIQAVKWIKNNLNENAFIAIDNYSYVDLREKKFKDDKIFSNAEMFQKINLDPSIKSGKLNNDWRKIEYIALSHEMLKQLKSSPQDLEYLKLAFENSTPVIEWKDDSISYIDLPNSISTNGDWAAVYKVKSRNDIVLDMSWKYYKKNFINLDGQVIDPQNYNTTSEGQSYALLRSVWQNDRSTFDVVLKWTKDHLQYRNEDKLFSWLWQKDKNGYKLGDFAAATDADEDIALALLFAYKQWEDENYLNAAREIINDIWKNEVIDINGKYYLIAGTSAETNSGYLVNPSYIAPAHYRIFSKIDKSHPWNKLASDSYELLNILGKLNGNTTYLPPNWITVDKKNGSIGSASDHIQDIYADAYGYDAFRITWRVALDQLWFNRPEAKAYLTKTTAYFKKQWISQRKFPSIIDLKGNTYISNPGLSTDIGPLASSTLVDRALAEDIYSQNINSRFDYSQGYWGDKDNYYDQNWGWFGAALHTNNLPNLWVNPSKSTLN